MATVEQSFFEQSDSQYHAYRVVTTPTEAVSQLTPVTRRTTPLLPD